MKTGSLLSLAFSLLLATGLPQTAAATEPVPDKDPTGDAGALKDKVETGCGYDPRTGNASRSITDLHVPGAVGENGLAFTRHWNSLQAQPDLPTSTQSDPFGPAGWSHSWHWSVFYDTLPIQASDGGLQTFETSLTITFPDGRVTKYFIQRGPATPHYGPPYSPQEACWTAGGTVSDHLCGMQADGKKFWLYLGDGGSVRFEESPSTPWLPTAVVGYRATVMIDRHGLETNLFYNDLGNLIRVTEPGGRSILITWRYLPGKPDPVIAQVSGGGPQNVAQAVQYNYTLYQIPVDPPATGGVISYALTGVNYGVGERPATYHYRNMPTDQIGLVLDEADDPRFMGPMKRIRYSYHDTWCGTGPQLDFYKAPPTAITAEMNEQNLVVSSLFINCAAGTRTETNGLWASRMFYYGRSVPLEPGSHFEGSLQTGHWIPPEAGLFNHLSHHLVKITNFNPGVAWESVPFHYQHYYLAYPWRFFDPNGNITQVTTAQDGTGRPTEVWHRADNSKHTYNWSNPGASLARDAMHIPNTLNHWLFSETDERNLTTTYTRDALRLVTDIIYPDNTGTEHFTYNSFNQVITHRLANNTVVHYAYDSRGLLGAEWNEADGEAAATFYYYDPLDRVWIVQNALARNRGFSYSAMMEYNNRHQVTKVHYPPTGSNSDPTVRYDYNPDGDCIAITNELGYQSVYKYDNYRRVIKYIEPLNAPGYDGSGNVATRQWNWYYGRPTTNGVPLSPYAHTSKQWTQQYEPAYNAAGDCRVTVREYDVNDRMTAEQTGWIKPAQGSLYFSAADGETHHFTYDANGNKSSYTDPRDRLTTYEYNSRNLLITTTETATTPPRITRTGYDVAGNKTLVTFPDSRTQKWPAYDPFGQPRVFIDERDNHTYLNYWPWGPMKKLSEVITHRTKDGGGGEDQTTTFYYDGMGRPKDAYFPDNSHEYTEYQFGQPITWMTRKGQTKHIHYDVRGREDYHLWDNGAAPGITRVWDDAHRLTSITNAFSTIDYGYDNAGQAKWEGTNVTGSAGRKQLTYYRYPSGEVSRQVYPDGAATVLREYTARGQLQSVNWAGGNASYTYLADGKVDREDYGNLLQTKYEYDARGMIDSVRHWNPAANHDLAYRKYFRADNRDRISAWKRGYDQTYNLMEDGRGDRYGYDYEGQLTAASYRAENPDDTATTPYRIDTFSYDELGNRKEWNDVASRGAMWMVRKDNGLNEYSSWQNSHPSPDPLHWGSATNYDDDVGGTWGSPGHANGVLMQDGYITAGFNALNQPMAIWVSAYGWGASAQWMWFGFDPLGRCVKRWMGPDTGGAVTTVQATYFYYDGWDLLQEGNETANNVARLYVHGGRVDEIVASQGGGQWRYHHYDARGHCILLTSSNGTLMEQYDYDAFGFPYFYNRAGAKQGPQLYGNRFLFTGREWLGDLRLYDFRNRMYQPELGRFLQPDPKQFEAGDYNLYRYCHNDPIDGSDPDGLVNLSYTPLDQTEAIKWEKSYNPAGHFSIAGHADENGNILGANGKVITIQQMMRDMFVKGYKPGTPIIEVVCNSGKGGENSQAAQLARAMKEATGSTTSVHAPTTDVGAYRPGAPPAPLWAKKPDWTQRRGMDKYDKSKPGKYQAYTVESTPRDSKRH